MLELIKFTLLILLAVVGLSVLWFLLNWLGLYVRQNFLGKARANELRAGFPSEEFFPNAANEKVVGLSDFSHVYKQARWGGLLEIYNLISGQSDGIEYAAFDLRTAGGSNRSAHTRSVFVMRMSGASLISFELALESFGTAVLWGEDPDIDIENDFVFSKTYHLSGPERNSVRLLFDPELVGFIKTHMLFFNTGGLSVHNESLMFRAGNKQSSEEIKESLKVLRQLLLLLAAKSKDIVTIVV